MRGVRHAAWTVPALGVLAATAAGDVVTIGASKDNTLYQDPEGTLSNGIGPGFFAGTTAQGEIRRGLVAFDIAAAVPAGSTITGVTLTLHMSSSMVSPVNVSLMRVLADWGEGTSNAGATGGGGAPATPGDATWVHRFYPGTLWANPGGDIAPGASAVQSVSNIAFYTWGGPGVVADVQGWLDAPGSNFGWLLKGDETALATAKRFDSRENLSASARPALQITYTVPAPGGGVMVLAGAAVAGRRRRR
jgi:hypothetical protein